jgi:outer membrane protein OmpA-like peptidoglycan-associated protein
METWVKVDPGNNDGKRYVLTIVEKAVMAQDVVADADAMAKGIIQSGHMAVYGIYFDSAKAVVKKESDASIEQIAKLMSDNHHLNLYVVGHTDSDGKLEYNMDLSKRRAKAVVDILTNRYNISGKRLIAKGLGPLAPVASNRSPEGRAKNRRVELVEKLN